MRRGVGLLMSLGAVGAAVAGIMALAGGGSITYIDKSSSAVIPVYVDDCSKYRNVQADNAGGDSDQVPSSSSWKDDFSYIDELLKRANYYGSNTRWCLAVDVDRCRCAVFENSGNEWVLSAAWDTAQGRKDGSRSSTAKGVWKVKTREAETEWGKNIVYFGSSSSYQAFASGDSSPNGSAEYSTRGETRLSDGNAKWVYSNIPNNTTVVVFDSVDPWPQEGQVDNEPSGGSNSKGLSAGRSDGLPADYESKSTIGAVHRAGWEETTSLEGAALAREAVRLSSGDDRVAAEYPNTKSDDDRVSEYVSTRDRLISGSNSVAGEPYPGDYASGDMAVAVAVRSSGIDKSFEYNTVAKIARYLDGSDKWRNLGYWESGQSTNALKPGDVLSNGKYVCIYVGADAASTVGASGRFYGAMYSTTRNRSVYPCLSDTPLASNAGRFSIYRYGAAAVSSGANASSGVSASNSSDADAIPDWCKEVAEENTEQESGKWDGAGLQSLASANDTQKHIVDVAQSGRVIPYPHMCQAWALEVLQEAGVVPWDRAWCCAHHAMDDSPPRSSDLSNIPVGACVFSDKVNIGCPVCGRDAGHVGIYIGDGMVMENLEGRVQTKPLSQWVSERQGWFPGAHITWGWMGGYEAE